MFQCRELWSHPGNVTVPVGVPEPGALAVIVAVNVTDWPNTEGLAEEVTTETVAS